jgi:uncharacterized protein YjcR
MMTRGEQSVLVEMWHAGHRVREIADRLGVHISTVNDYRRRVGLQDRGLNHQGQPDDPSPEDEAASQAGLALAPSVARAARIIRQRHLERMAGAR